MDYNEYENGGCFGHIFRTFVCVTLSLLLGLQAYSYMWGSQDLVEGDFSDIKYVVMQLTHGLSEKWVKSHSKIPLHTRTNIEVDASSFIIRTAKDWNNVSSSVYPSDYNERLFKERMNRLFLSTCDLPPLTIHHQVTRKHERLQGEMERISAELPAVVAAAGRAKDALEPARRAQRTALETRDYDRQLADYALETAGARILDTGDTAEHMIYDSAVSWVLHAFSSALCRDCLGAAAIIRPGTLPGECWAFKGSRGEATIRLLGTVYITGISVEHIAAHISPTREISSAPRLFQLEGLEYRSDPYPHDFGTYEYDKEGKPIQFFTITHPSTKSYNLVRFRVLSNWGHSVYTCVYRIRVHGDLAPGQAPLQSTLAREDQDLRIENE